MSIYHETEDSETLLFKQQRFLSSKLQFMEDTPSWFERRMEEETGITDNDLEVIEATGTPGDCGLLPQAKLDALEVFLRRWAAGAITEKAGEQVIATESPYAARVEAKPSALLPKPPRQSKVKDNEEPHNPMNATSLLKRFDKLEKPWGFNGRFCKQFGFSTSTLAAILKGKASSETMEKFEKAVDAAEAGKLKMNGEKPARLPREQQIKAAAAATERINHRERPDTVQIPRPLLPFVISALQTQRAQLDAQIAELQELS